MNDEQKARVIANCEIIAKALREGAPLQWRWCAGEAWRDINPSDGISSASCFEYRIKPEPRTIWVNEYADGHLGSSWDTEEKARNSAGADAARIAVEYREVLK